DEVLKWKSDHPTAQTGDFAQTAAFADIIVLAVSGLVAMNAIQIAGPQHFNGKIVIDPTNPIAKDPPEDGVLKFFTDLNESLMEKLQKRTPQARFVKAFNSVGNSLMYKPQFPGGEKPTMFICGNDADAKKDVTQLLELFGWETEDMGTAAAARAIEPMCILWCIPGFLHNSWNHAFRLLKK
ncbi:MAG: DNA-binding protein, partial [Bacteroidetes bacterium]|nr:DNA-binding protein [Bacteroidota bacterium]